MKIIQLNNTFSPVDGVPVNLVILHLLRHYDKITLRLKHLLFYWFIQTL